MLEQWFRCRGAQVVMVPRSWSDGPAPPRHSLLLREMLFTAADHARRTDPQLAATYVRLTHGDRHRNSAICHLTTDNEAAKSADHRGCEAWL